ncbi:MAG: VapB-type antitoxin [Candidatus Brockarchaeota archaeon]|nr:VapB-type antitoxin [Candidatus Brockarchaeota archaeon]
MAEMVKIDERGRMTLPRPMRRGGGGRAIIISAGTFHVLIPVDKKPAEAAGGWLKSEKETSHLKKLAESRAREDAVSRAKRKSQA